METGLCEEGLGPRGLAHPTKSGCHQLQEDVSTIHKLTRPQVGVRSGTHGRPAPPLLDSMARKGRQGCEWSSSVAQQGVCPCVSHPGHCSTGAFQETFPAQLGEGIPPPGVLEALVPGVKGRPARDRTKAGRGAGATKSAGERAPGGPLPCWPHSPHKKKAFRSNLLSTASSLTFTGRLFLRQTLSTTATGARENGVFQAPSPSHTVPRSPLLGEEPGAGSHPTRLPEPSPLLVSAAAPSEAGSALCSLRPLRWGPRLLPTSSARSKGLQGPPWPTSPSASQGSDHLMASGHASCLGTRGCQVLLTELLPV